MGLKTKKLEINGVEYDLTSDGSDSNIDIIDNLESTDSNSALSANQGKILNDKINNLNTDGFNVSVEQTLTNGVKIATIAVDETVVDLYAPENTGTTYDIATETEDGLMSSEDKTKLNNINLDTKVDKTTKVNGKELSSDVTLSASDVGADESGAAATALTNAKSYTDTKVADKVDKTITINSKPLSSNINLTASDIGADASGTASNQITSHNIATTAHNDIRLLITGLTERLNALADSDDTTLDQMSEIVAYIKNNKSLIDSVTTSKVNVADIINNLTTNVSNKPLAAAQGVALKGLIDALQTEVNNKAKASDLTSHTNASDVHVTSAAKASWNSAATNSHTHSNKTILDGTTASYTTEEKTKLSGIAEGANKTIVDNALSTTSTNPVQNKTITTALDGKVNILNLGGTIGTAKYQAFASFPKENATGDGHATFLISGMGSFGGKKQGSCIVTISNRGSVATMEVTTISPWDSGTITFGYYTSGSNFYFGLYVANYRGTCNVIILQNSAASIGDFYDSSTAPTGWTAVTPRTLQDDSHTHNYAGSSSAGGSATSAVKLDTTTAGSATQPVYFSGGKPVATTYTLGASVPSGAKFTDTTYSAATKNVAGLMSAADKIKLDAIATGANNYTHPTYTAKTSGLYKVTVDASGHVSGTSAVAKTDITALGIPAQDTTYSAATQSANGLMSAADKKKLDGIATGANAYTHPTTSGNKHIPSGGSSGQILRWSADGTAVWGNDNNTTYSQATSSALGLVKIGYTTSGKNYAVALDSNGKMYVNVPWTDNNTTYSAFKAATSSAAGGAGLVPAPAAGAQGKFLRGDGTWQTPTNTTYNNFVKSGRGAAAGLVPAPPTTAGTSKYLREDGTWTAPPNSSAATKSAAGLMSAADKKKLDGVVTTNNTAIGDLGYTTGNATTLPTLGTLAYWNGRYNSTKSNLAYCSKGAFGDAAIKGVDTTPTNGSTNLITSDAVYDGLARKSGTGHTHSSVLDAGDGRAITFAYSKNGMSTTSWLASWNGAQLEAISPANALKAMRGVSTSGGTITGDFVVEKDLRVTDNYGIEDRKGNGLLYRNTNAVTLGSATNKTPVYVGTVDGNDITYIRGKYTVIGGSDLNYSSHPIYNLSDQRIKTNESLISEEINKYVDFFDKLQPRKYNYIRDEEDKAKTIGFFAQEVHQALLDSGLELEDFAGVNIEESFVEGWGEGTDEAMWYEDFYSLAYEQFIPIIVSKIQHMEQQYNNKLKALEEEYNNKLVSLEERLRKLEEV